MKTTKMLTILVLALVLVVWQAKVSKAAPMGTAWTYQGRLMEREQSAEGPYDLEFRLFDGPSDGNQTGGAVEANDVDVIDGYFTVELDFGPDVFTGYTRWLETTMRRGDSNDVNDFVTLSPRQELTPTPYAIYAKTTGAYDWRSPAATCIQSPPVMLA